MQDGDEGGAGREEGKDPYAEELVDGDVEDEILPIVCCARFMLILFAE